MRSILRCDRRKKREVKSVVPFPILGKKKNKVREFVLKIKSV